MIIANVFTKAKATLLRKTMAARAEQGASKRFTLATRHRQQLELQLAKAKALESKAWADYSKSKALVKSLAGAK